MTSNTPSRFMDVAIDWGRVEVWCELSSGKAICGPVLERLRAKAEEIEAERDDLEEQLEALRDTLAAVMVFVPESGATIRAGYGKAAREARELLASNPASEPKP